MIMARPRRPAGSSPRSAPDVDYTCGVKRGGAVACWGQNDYGQATPPAGEFASVSAGRSHTCGVKRDGGVACWGFDIRGVPSMLRDGVGVTRVNTGNVSICDVIEQDGAKVICRGDDSYTQGGGLVWVDTGDVLMCEGTVEQARLLGLLGIY